MRKTLFLSVISLAFLLGWPAAAYCQPPALVANSISVEGLRSIEREELLYLIDLKEGAALEPDAVTRGIKRAFLKGIFEDITVEAVDGGGVIVRVREREFIDDISVRGNPHVSDRFLKGVLPLKEGTAMRYDLVEESKESLKEALRQRGYPDAAVSIEVIKRDDPRRVGVRVHVKEGDPLIIRDIKVIGRHSSEVYDVMGLSVGDTYDQVRLREEMERVREYFIEAGYYNPTVGPYTFKGGELSIGLGTGKKLRIEVGGNTALRTKTILAIMPFSDAHDFNEELVKEASEKIVSLYHAEGYPSAQVAPVINEEDEAINAEFFIFEGDKVDVGDISFEGVTINEAKLKDIMSLKTGRPYNPDLLDSDLSSLEEFYVALGYLNVSLGAPRVTVEGGSANIEISVSEGGIVKISEIKIEGAEHFPEAEVRRAVKLAEGSPYNEVDLADARYRVMDLYGGQGFADARVDVVRELGEQGVKITFRVDEGVKTSIGKTVVKGNAKTRHKVIRREITYEEGMPLDYSKLAATRQALYKLSLFKSVNVEVADRYDGKADIAVRLEEDEPGTVEFGVGYGEYEKYRGSLDLSYRNLGGMNRQVGARLELSTLENRVIVNYYEPWFLDRRVPIRAFLLREEKKAKNIDTGEVTYRIRRYTASVGTERKVSRNAKAEIFYEFSLVKTFDVQPDVILTKEDTGTLAISSIRPGLVYDTRDNAFDPKKGFFAGLSVKVASDYLWSETDFVKAIVHGSTYQKLAGWLVAALSVRGGVAKGFGGTDELPLVERFFIGGRSTVRGYAQDSLGPKGTAGTPRGGDAFFVGNFELRFYALKNWSVVPFLDAGNVWTAVKEVDFADLKYSTGLGLRYNTPVGPIRLDYGIKLDREAEESASEIHFSIGHTF